MYVNSIRLSKKGLPTSNTYLMIRPMKRFHERLKEARKAAGFSSQEDFAEAIGIKRTNYQPFEKGKKLPDPEITIPKIAEGLGLSVDIVMAWYRLDNADRGQKIEILMELYSDEEIVEAVKKLKSERQ